MPRKPYTRKPLVQPKPDDRYGSVEIRVFINTLMLHGKYALASKIVYSALEKMANDVKTDARFSSDHHERVIQIFDHIVRAATPMVEVKSKRVGGATYQVPEEIRHKRRISLAYRWIIGFARQRVGMSMAEGLYREFSDIYNKRGATLKRREETHKMAEANRAFVKHKPSTPRQVDGQLA